MHIRPETPGDVPTIYALTKATFAQMAFSDGTEPDALNTLRDAGDLTLSLVAVDEGTIIGHAAFSPSFINDHFDKWYALGPIAVTASRQKQGIGKGLVQAGRATLELTGAKGFVLIGNPAVYRPMGFVSDAGLTYRDLETRIVQYLPFTDEIPHGEVTFAPALEAA